MAKNRTMAAKHAKARKMAVLEGIRRSLDTSIVDNDKPAQYPSLCTPVRPQNHNTYATKVERDFARENTSYFDDVTYKPTNNYITIEGIIMTKTMAEVLYKVNPTITLEVNHDKQCIS